MSTPAQPSPIAPEHLWWDAAESAYYAWDGADDAAADARHALVSLTAEARSAPRTRTTRVTVEAAAEVLQPIAGAALERIGSGLARLDPSFDLRWSGDLVGARIDVNDAVRRLLAKLQSAPEKTQSGFEAILVDVHTLLRVADFGPAAALVVARLGDATAAPAPAGPEASEATIARVRADVRAELDALAQSRPPMSFDWAELTKPPKDG